MAKTEKTAMAWILDRQISWAKGKALVSGTIKDGKESEDDKNYLETIKDNLFQVDNIKEKGLRQENINAYNKGGGNEIMEITSRPKMSALHSSSALVVNLFQYWQDQKDITPLLKALKLEIGNNNNKIGGNAIRFEKILQIKYMDGDKKKNVRGGKPNIDVVIEFEDKIIAIESKFTEPYNDNSNKNSKMQDSYIKKESLWKGIPNIEELVQAIYNQNYKIENEEIKELIEKLKKTKHLDASQLIKHILGLRTDDEIISKNKDITLLYLWYNVPGTEGYEHRKEIEEFKELLKDKIDFRSITYQEVISYLDENYKNEHKDYRDYLVKRYL